MSSKYRKIQKKKIWSRKIWRKRANLSRVSDITEIERCCLRKAIWNSKIYLNYREELKSRSIFVLKEYDKIHNLRKMLKTSKDCHRGFGRSKKEYENIKNEYQRLELQLEELDGSIGANKASYNEYLKGKQRVK